MSFKTDYIDLGPVPTMEPCSTIGFPSYETLSKIETTAFKAQLKKTFPGGDFVVRESSEGFHSVMAIIDVPTNDGDCTMTPRTIVAFRAEEDTPEIWTTESVDFLKSNKYFELLEENQKCLK